MDVFRNVTIVILFIFVIVSCFGDVLFRYLLLWSLGWTEEILRYLNVWIIFLGASVAAKRKAHLGMKFFLQLLPPKIRLRTEQIIYSTILLFLMIFITFGTKKSIQNFSQQIQAFPISIAWFYFAIPVGSLCMFVEFLLLLVYGNHPFYNPEGE
jgi:TRAP-type C4-dicarboxylate transport system permease small subunit